MESERSHHLHRQRHITKELNTIKIRSKRGIKSDPSKGEPNKKNITISGNWNKRSISPIRNLENGNQHIMTIV